MLGEELGQTQTAPAGRLAAMREAFDRTFAEAPLLVESAPVDLLGVTLGGDAFAIRLAETAGLFAERKITPVPTAEATLCGIAGLRGALMPVYDLGALLGYPLAALPRWLVVARAAPVAFAIETFDGQIKVEQSMMIGQAAARAHVSEAARNGDRMRPVVSLPSVVDAIRQRMPQSGQQKEQTR